MQKYASLLRLYLVFFGVRENLTARSLARPPVGDERALHAANSSLLSASLSPAAAAGVACRASPARGWRRRDVFSPRARREAGLLEAAVYLGRRRPGSAARFPRPGGVWRGGAAVGRGRRGSPLVAGWLLVGGRRRSVGPNLGPLGPIWGWAGRGRRGGVFSGRR